MQELSPALSSGASLAVTRVVPSLVWPIALCLGWGAAAASVCSGGFSTTGAFSESSVLEMGSWALSP